jgi:hypothetical protein
MELQAALVTSQSGYGPKVFEAQALADQRFADLAQAQERLETMQRNMPESAEIAELELIVRGRLLLWQSACNRIAARDSAA